MVAGRARVERPLIRDLSARGHARVLRVARTVADLDGAGTVGADHVLQAIAFRQDAEAEEAVA